VRRKRVELEQAVIACAREWRTLNAKTVTMGLVEALEYAEAFYARMEVAVDALNEYEAAELTGAGVPYAAGSDTSHLSATLCIPVQGSARHAIVGLLSNVSELARPGYTDEQLERRLHRPHQTVSSARNWLTNAGWVIDSGVRRKNASSTRQAVVWQLSPAGWAKLREGP
jgi:hypothetical protein